MSNLYELNAVGQGYQFINRAGDQYDVYLTTYSLLDPINPNKTGYVNVYMLGFNCKRATPKARHLFNAEPKNTIFFVFKAFMDLYPDDAFVFICDNSDGRARNRRITFGRWFAENNDVYECLNSHISYQGSDWFSSLMFRKADPQKYKFINAYEYTLKQMIA